MAATLHSEFTTPDKPAATVMELALRRSGVKLPGEKLSDLCMDAVRTFNKRSGQRKHVSDALRGELCFALIEQWRPSALGEAIGWALDRAQATLEAEEAEKHPEKAEAAAAARIAAAVKREQRENAEPIPFTMPQPITGWDREGKFANDEAKAAKQFGALARTAVKLSKLDDFMVNGQPIGDLTPEEANGWAASRERDARFVRLLTAGLPAGRPIRQFRKGDEADKLYAAAEALRDKA
jgi:hypothetical protein